MTASLRTPSGSATADGASLIGPGAVGTLGAGCVLAGSLQPGSPFTVSSADAWFWGAGAPGAGTARFVGLMLVYGGMAALLGAWYEILVRVRARPGFPVGPLAVVLVAWEIPVLVSAPLFSGDVYSYAAQGEMVSRGLNPYVRHPSALGPGPWLHLVDPLWRRATAPYGPAWERLSEAIVRMAGHDVPGAVLGFRVVALIGVTLVAVSVPVLARSVGGQGAPAFVLGVLNPLVLLGLLGGAHNDALMLGLLTAACALARTNRVGAGLCLSALAAEVKVPALIGAVCIGWWWAGTGARPLRRLARVGLALAVTVAVMVGIGAVAGLGWRWVSGLSDPGAVVSWLDPATAVGLGLSHVAGWVGAPGHQSALVAGARVVALGVALVLGARLVLRASGPGELRALGWCLVLVVVLGPVVWPWYETWGLVFLAVVAEGWVVGFIVVVTAVGCVADVPRPGLLLDGNPVVVSLFWVLLAAGVCLFGGRRVIGVTRRGGGCPAPPGTQGVGSGEGVSG